MDHRYYLTQRYGQDVGSARATRDFADNVSPDVFKRAWQRLQERWRGEVPEK